MKKEFETLPDDRQKVRTKSGRLLHLNASSVDAETVKTEQNDLFGQKFAEQFAEQMKKDEEANTALRRKLPKNALVLPVNGERPDGLTTRTAAKIIFDGVEFVLDRPEQYVLTVFAYTNDVDETTEADKNAKAKLADKAERAKYIELRNAVLSLYYFGLNLYNDVWALVELAERLKSDVPNKERTDADKERAKSLQTLFDVQRFRVEAELTAVERFCKTFDVPEYLMPSNVKKARHVYKQNCSAKLFDLFEHTVNAREFERMFDGYLMTRKANLKNY